MKPNETEPLDWTPDEPRPGPPIPKKKRHSKTVWGLVTAAAGLIAIVSGLEPEQVQFLADGLQVTDLPAAATLIGALLAAYGIRAAKQPLS